MLRCILFTSRVSLARLRYLTIVQPNKWSSSCLGRCSRFPLGRLPARCLASLQSEMWICRSSHECVPADRPKVTGPGRGNDSVQLRHTAARSQRFTVICGNLGSSSSLSSLLSQRKSLLHRSLARTAEVITDWVTQRQKRAD